MRAKRDFLSLYDLSAEELQQLLQRAIALKGQRAQGELEQSLRGKSLAMIFEKSSTRTRVSFEVGMYELGGHAVYLAGQGSQIGRGEPIADTARVLSEYCSAILIRTYEHERLLELAEASSIPVINALTDSFHPCQLLADLQTIVECRQQIDGLEFAWVGDGNNMAHSWIRAAAVLGFSLRLACPKGYQPDARIVAEARERMAVSGQGQILISEDPREAVGGADVVSTDVWASMGQEDEQAKRELAFTDYCVDSHLLKLAAPDAHVLHCLPAHRGEEISAEVIDGSQSVVWQQAGNRLHAQKALLEFLVTPKHGS